MRTLKLEISFDGTGYSGWQRQDNGITIQEEIERCTSLICNSETTIHGAGRTDAGVHARGMTAHFKSASTIGCPDLLQALNSLLPPAIRILRVTDESEDFHARFSALGKTYRYSIFSGQIQCPTERFYAAHFPYDLDLHAVRQSCEIIVGTHDFSSFENVGSRDRNRIEGRGAVRTMYRAWLETPEPHTLQLFFTGDGFLRQMVRNLVGTIMEVARGKLGVADFTSVLKARDRTVAGATAPPHGLTLLQVHYQKDWEDSCGE